MLQNAGLITREQFDEALKNRVLYGGKIGTSLIELGYVREDDLARFLSSKLAVPFIAAERLLAISAETIQLIPRDLALTYRVIPLHRDKKRLYLVMADPADLKAIDEISFITGFIVKPVIAPEVRLIQALGKYYGFEVDHRYQQIIGRIEQEKSAARPAPAVAPPRQRRKRPPSRRQSRSRKLSWTSPSIPRKNWKKSSSLARRKNGSSWSAATRSTMSPTPLPGPRTGKKSPASSSTTWARSSSGSPCS